MAVAPPGSSSTVYFEWPNESFASNQERTFTQTYSLLQDGQYQITAYIYDVHGKENNWHSDHLYDSRSERFTVKPYDFDADADAEDISVSPSTVIVGQSATITAQFQNETESVDGAATFDLRLAVDPPGFGNTVYYEWTNQSFTRNQRAPSPRVTPSARKAITKSLPISMTFTARRTAGPRRTGFDSYSGDLTVSGPIYDADAEDVYLSANTVYIDQTVAISAQFQNLSPAGAGAFDLRLAVDPPGSRNTVYFEWPNQSFASNQERTFTQTYSLLQDGQYQITAYIYDVHGKENNWHSDHLFDSRSESFTVKPYDFDAAAEDISLSVSSVPLGQTATISAQFQNETESVDGAATFDLRLAVTRLAYLPLSTMNGWISLLPGTSSAHSPRITLSARQAITKSLPISMTFTARRTTGPPRTDSTPTPRTSRSKAALPTLPTQRKSPFPPALSALASPPPYRPSSGIYRLQGGNIRPAPGGGPARLP